MDTRTVSPDSSSSTASIRPVRLFRVPGLQRLPLTIPAATLFLLLGCVPGGAAQDAPPPAPGSQTIPDGIRPPDRAGDPTIDPAWEGVRLVRPLQDQDELSVLTVSGEAEVEAEPDRARVHFAVETEGETAAAAGQLNAARMNQVMASVREAGQETEGLRVETFGYALQPRYGAVQADRSREIVGYTARNTLQVTVDDVDGVGGLIDAALGAGANRVASLVFEVRDPGPYRREALQEAIREARAEAEVMAAALGMELGRPIEVQGGANVPFPRPFFQSADRAMEMASMQAPTPVEAGLQTISASVTIRFRLEPEG